VLVPLEHGAVLAIGGLDASGAAAGPLVYRPMQGWLALPDPAPIRLVDHSAARLADGSVLIVGGSDGVGTLATAWRFRPASLVGPFTGSVTITPSPDENDRVQLVALDPGLVDRTNDGYLLRSEGTFENVAVIAGPELASGTLTTNLAIGATGWFGLIAQATGPGNRVEVVMQPQQNARVDRVQDGTRTTLCTGEIVPVLSGTVGVTLTLTIEGSALTVQRDAETDVRGCDLGDKVSGLWGVAAHGGAAIEVRTISLDR
jgi:hypothetical protein